MTLEVCDGVPDLALAHRQVSAFPFEYSVGVFPRKIGNVVFSHAKHRQPSE